MKPSNILIDKCGHLKITDFGLSKSIVETGKASSLCGTHEYLSPEMLNGLEYDFSVDFWALGIIAFRLLCGFFPFHHPNLVVMYDKISECKYRIPRNVDANSRDFIEGLLKKDPCERLKIEAIKNHAYFGDIDWLKVYKKEYEMEFVPYRADDESGYNFDSGLFDCESDSSGSNNSACSNSSVDLGINIEKSFIKGFDFFSNDEIFDD